MKFKGLMKWGTTFRFLEGETLPEIVKEAAALAVKWEQPVQISEMHVYHGLEKPEEYPEYRGYVDTEGWFHTVGVRATAR